MNPHEGMEVLKQLQITPEHFKFGLTPVKVGEQVQQYMTIECLVNRLGYRPECMIKDFGFEWTPQWSVADMVNLGINIEMAVQSGMRDPFQWMHVKAAATPEQLTAFLWSPEWDTLLSRQSQAQPTTPVSASLYAQPMAPQQQAPVVSQQAFYGQPMAPAFAGPASSVALPPAAFVPALVRPPAPPVQQQQQPMVLPVIHQVVPMQDDGKRHVVQAIQMSAPLPVPAVPVNGPNQVSNGRPKLLPYPVPRFK